MEIIDSSNKYDQLYEQYKTKCKELGIKPSSMREIFGSEIEREKNENHISISDLSRARKAKAPTLSETAKEAIQTQDKSSKQKLMQKVNKPKRVLLSEEEKIARKEQRKAYIKNNPEVHERKKAQERERYQKRKSDPMQAEKLREKWRRDHERKKEKKKKR